MKKSTLIIIWVLVGITSVVGGLAGALGGTALANTFYPGNNSAAVPSGDYRVLDEIRQIVRDYSLWGGEEEEMLSNAADAMLFGSRDIYSDYFTMEEYDSYATELEGEYQGVGMRVALSQEDGLVDILYVYKDSPAEKAGLRRGDKIVSVDGESVPLYDLETVKDKVRGTAGSPVELGILRNGETLTLTAIRGAVVAANCEWNMITREVGYIRIMEFYGNAGELFEQGVNEMLSQGMQGLIIDLRDNAGGDKDMVCGIADTLLPKGDIITMIDKNGEVLDREVSDAAYLGIPLVVLINENTASASELLAGNIQDYGMGTLVGVTTYGKGVGQTFRQLSDGSVVRFTAFEYLTGGGRCPQDVGISPDVEVEMSDEVYYDQLLWCTDRDEQFLKALTTVEQMLD